MKRLLRSLILALALSPMAAIATGPVDINAADAASLEQVKGIGPAKASAIVQFREQNGPFASVDDLVQVPGLGEKTVAQIRDQLKVGADGSTKKK
ncbi:MAG TPA: helix-hairpin-helix domain-containing protein [Rhodocyclaceae bacterium]|jgi:competence protein ComEA|nr:helix-hairpin-helix domain-containing protein [Rhodocyclaceae bacterium]HRQ45655.1 helix-hairpin-helix domain-containing protein [Rhodocyclaceae bacterium]